MNLWMKQKGKVRVFLINFKNTNFPDGPHFFYDPAQMVWELRTLFTIYHKREMATYLEKNWVAATTFGIIAIHWFAHVM